MANEEETEEQVEGHVPLEDVIKNTADYARIQLENARARRDRVDLRAYVNASYEVVKNVKRGRGDWFLTRRIFGYGDPRMLACLNRCLKGLLDQQYSEMMRKSWLRVAFRHILDEIPACARECRTHHVNLLGSYGHFSALMIYETLKKVFGAKPDHKEIARDLARYLFDLLGAKIPKPRRREVLAAIESLSLTNKSRFVKLYAKLAEIADSRRDLSDPDAQDLVRICRGAL